MFHTGTLIQYIVGGRFHPERRQLKMEGNMTTACGITIVFTDAAFALERLHEATETSDQQQLAAFFGVRQSAISDARRRNQFPLTWLLEVQRVRKISPLWVLTGNGNKYAQD